MGCGGSKEEEPKKNEELKVNNSTREIARVEEDLSPGVALKRGDIESKDGEYDYLLKFLIIGESNVGKSSLLSRFADDEYGDGYRVTVGVDFKIRTIKVGDKLVKLQVWDTAGQERFRSVTKSFYNGAHAVLLVYDITSEASFQNLIDHWVPEAQKFVPKTSSFLLVGNKLDLEADNRQVTNDAAHSLAENINALFLETSAKDATNVNKAFFTISSHILSNIK